MLIVYLGKPETCHLQAHAFDTKGAGFESLFEKDAFKGRCVSAHVVVIILIRCAYTYTRVKAAFPRPEIGKQKKNNQPNNTTTTTARRMPN